MHLSHWGFGLGSKHLSALEAKEYARIVDHALVGR